MVQAMINISEQVNQLLNIIKARYSLKDKSQAIEYVVKEYGACLLEPDLRPEFTAKMKERQKEPAIRIKDFKKHFNLG